jgi:hypothetical protein
MHYSSYEDHYCSECEDYEAKLKDLKYWSQVIIDYFYLLEEMEHQELQYALEEIAHLSDIKLPGLMLSKFNQSKVA